MMLLAPGRRRQSLQAAISKILDYDFADRVLPFDRDAAGAYAPIAAERRRTGRPIGHSDTLIAGLVRSRGAVLATRNTRDFLDCGIVVVDPWSSDP